MFGSTSCTGGESNIGECKGIIPNSPCNERDSKDGWVKCQPGRSINCASHINTEYTIQPIAPMEQ